VRILFVTRGFPPKGLWGSEGYSHDLAKALVRDGHEVHVFYPLIGKGGERWKTEDGISVVEAAFRRRMGKPFRDSYFDPRQDAALARFFAEHGSFDRVHFTALAGEVSVGLLPVARAHADEVLVTLTELLPYCHRGQLLDAQLSACPGPSPKACSACVMAKGPWSSRGDKAPWKRALVRALSAFGQLAPLPTPAAFRQRTRFIAECLEAVTLFLLPSEGLLEQYAALGLPRHRMRYLPYALDLERYAEYSKIESTGPLRIAYLGQIAPHKGVHILIEALAAMDASLRKQLHVTLHGAATAAQHARFGPALASRIQEAGLDIAMPGPFPPHEVARVLSACDLVVIPSLWIENLPLVLLHARACGLPILASAVAGIRGFIDHGKDGYLIPPAQAPAWTKALERLAHAHAGSDEAAGTEWTRVQEGAKTRGIPIDLQAHLAALREHASIP